MTYLDVIWVECDNHNTDNEEHNKDWSGFFIPIHTKTSFKTCSVMHSIANKVGCHNILNQGFIDPKAGEGMTSCVTAMLYQ